LLQSLPLRPALRRLPRDRESHRLLPLLQHLLEFVLLRLERCDLQLAPRLLLPDNPPHKRLLPHGLRLPLLRRELPDLERLLLLGRDREFRCARKHRERRAKLEPHRAHRALSALRRERRVPRERRRHRRNDILYDRADPPHRDNFARGRRKVHVLERRNNFVRRPERKAGRAVRRGKDVPAAHRRHDSRNGLAVLVVDPVDATTKLRLEDSGRGQVFRRRNRASRSTRVSQRHAAVHLLRNATRKANANCIRFVRAPVQVRADV
jgi:hypothetical protein